MYFFTTITKKGPCLLFAHINIQMLAKIAKLQHYKQFDCSLRQLTRTYMYVFFSFRFLYCFEHERRHGGGMFKLWITAKELLLGRILQYVSNLSVTYSTLDFHNYLTYLLKIWHAYCFHNVDTKEFYGH